MKFLLLPSLAALFGAVALAGPDRAVSVVSDSVTLRVDVDRPILPAGSTQRAVVKVSLEPLRRPEPGRRPPVNLALVLDRSGSMSGEKLERAKAAALEAVRRLGPDDIFSLVVYNNRVETLIPARRVGRGEGFEAIIREIEATGGTALYGGLVRGAEQVRDGLESGCFTHRVLLLSDGLANVGPSSPEEVARFGASLGRDGISVTTVGVGLDYNEDLMTRLAQRSDGNTYFVASARDLPGIFNAELGDVLNVVARRVYVTIEFPDGVRPLAFVGREGRIHPQRAEFTLNQLYGGQERFALIEVEVTGDAGAERELARAEARYEDAFTQRTATVQARRTVSFSRDERTVVKAANHRVQADYARNVIAEVKDAAVELVDSNRKDEAAQHLRDRAKILHDIGSSYGNPEVLSLAGAGAAEADRIERQGLAPAARKAYRAENAQTRSQQTTGSPK